MLEPKSQRGHLVVTCFAAFASLEDCSLCHFSVSAAGLEPKSGILQLALLHPCRTAVCILPFLVLHRPPAQRGTLLVSRCAFQGCPHLRNSAFAGLPCFMGAEGARAADRMMKQWPGLDMRSQEQSSGFLITDPSDLLVCLELLQHDESFFASFTE